MDPQARIGSLPPEGAAPVLGAARQAGELLDERSLGKLRWRCRRGLLENDLFIERYFRDHAATITNRQAEALMALMDLPDHDLLDLLLARCEPCDGLDRPEVHQVLALLRRVRPSDD